MNYFLLFIILAICGGSYYEYTLQQKSDVNYQQQASALAGQIANLQADKTKIEREKAKLSKNLADVQAQITDLNSQIAAAAAKAAKDAAEAAAKAAAKAAPLPPKPPPPPPVFSNDLGTIAALNGKTFQNCRLLRVETDGITFNYSSGITKVLFPLLPFALQKKFGYDPKNGAVITAETVQALEAKRKAAPSTTDRH
jgi:multidrug efflux pump subunit AcrA (membrane-fusion protein)